MLLGKFAHFKLGMCRRMVDTEIGGLMSLTELNPLLYRLFQLRRGTVEVLMRAVAKNPHPPMYTTTSSPTAGRQGNHRTQGFLSTPSGGPLGRDGLDH